MKKSALITKMVHILFNLKLIKIAKVPTVWLGMESNYVNKISGNIYRKEANIGVGRAIVILMAVIGNEIN